MNACDFSLHDEIILYILLCYLPFLLDIVGTSSHANKHSYHFNGCIVFDFMVLPYSFSFFPPFGRKEEKLNKLLSARVS